MKNEDRYFTQKSDVTGAITDFIKICQEDGRDWQEELDDVLSEAQEERRGCLNHWESEFGQPSEKKALSRKDIVELLEGHFSIREYNRMMAIAQSIFDALPAQREVRYPDKMEHHGWCSVVTDCDTKCDCGADKFNQAIDEFKKLNS